MNKQELENQLDHLKDTLRYHDTCIKNYEARVKEHKIARKETFDKREELRKQYEQE